MKKKTKLLTPLVTLIPVSTALSAIALTTSCGQKLHEEKHIIDPTEEERSKITAPGEKSAIYTLRLDTDITGDRFSILVIPSSNVDVELQAEVVSATGKELKFKITIVDELKDTGNFSSAFALKFTSEVYGWYQQVTGFSINYVAANLKAIYLNSNKLQVEWGVPAAGKLFVESHIPADSKIIKTTAEVNGNGLSYDVESGNVNINKPDGGGTITVKCTDSNGVTSSSICTVTSKNNVDKIHISGQHNIDIEEITERPHYFYSYDDLGRDQNVNTTWEVIEGKDLCELKQDAVTQPVYLTLTEAGKNYGGAITLRAKFSNDITVRYATHKIELAHFNKLNREKLLIHQAACLDDSISGHLIIPNVFYDANDEPVDITTIHTSAFSNCKKLTSIQFPTNFNKLDPQAFSGCTGLENVSVVDSNPCFTVKNYCMITKEGCSMGTWAGEQCIVLGTKNSVLNTDLFDTILGVGDYVFQNLQLPETSTGAVAVVLSDKVKYIGEKAFSNTNITELQFVESQAPADNCIIGKNAFEYCSQLTTAYLQFASTTHIDTGVFNECGTLKTVTVPNNCNTIETSAFAKCTLESLAFYNPLMYIWCIDSTSYDKPTWQPTETSAENAEFINSVSGLTNKTLNRASWYLEFKKVADNEVSIGLGGTGGGTSPEANLNIVNTHYMFGHKNDVTAISDNGFLNCTNLKKVTTEKSSKINTIGANGFSGCTSLESVDFRNTQLTTIGAYAFNNCASLTQTYFDGLPITSIGEHAFYNCSDLTQLDLSAATITDIANNCFENSKKIEIIDLSSSTIKTVNQGAFAGCTALVRLLCNWDSTVSIGEGVFNGCNNLALDFPSNTTIASIGAHAFMNTLAMKQFDFSKVNGVIANSAFNTCGLQKVDMSNITLTDNTIPEHCFRGSTALTEVNLTSDSVKIIENNAFRNCPNIKTIRIGANVQEMIYHQVNRRQFLIDDQYKKETLTPRTLYIDSQAIMTAGDAETDEFCGYLFSVDVGVTKVFVKDGLTIKGGGYFSNHFKKLATSSEAGYSEWVVK